MTAGLTGPGCSGSNNQGDGLASLEGSGLQLPPDFVPVDLPVERRKEIFREAHLVRARAVQEANRRLPMDEANLPIGDTEAFDKRVADHRAIIDEILEVNLAELAGRFEISTEELSKIEEEASRLRWIPPEEPKAEDFPAPTPAPVEEAAPPPAEGDSAGETPQS
jgi:hypothetical protein